MILIINPSTKFSTPQCQFCIRKNERTFPSKRARVFLKTNGRFASNVRMFYPE